MKYCKIPAKKKRETKTIRFSYKYATFKISILCLMKKCLKVIKQRKIQKKDKKRNMYKN